MIVLMTPAWATINRLPGSRPSRPRNAGQALSRRSRKFSPPGGRNPAKSAPRSANSSGSLSANSPIDLSSHSPNDISRSPATSSNGASVEAAIISAVSRARLSPLWTTLSNRAPDRARAAAAACRLPKSDSGRSAHPRKRISSSGSSGLPCRTRYMVDCIGTLPPTGSFCPFRVQ